MERVRSAVDYLGELGFRAYAERSDELCVALVFDSVDFVNQSRTNPAPIRRRFQQCVTPSSEASDDPQERVVK